MKQKMEFATMKTWDVIDYLKSIQKHSLAWKVENEVERHVALMGYLYKVSDLKQIIPVKMFREMETKVISYISIEK
jgi:hypothetical protein